MPTKNTVHYPHTEHLAAIAVFTLAGVDFTAFGAGHTHTFTYLIGLGQEPAIRHNRVPADHQHKRPGIVIIDVAKSLIDVCEETFAAEIIDYGHHS